MADEKRTVLLEIVVDSKGAAKGVAEYTKAVDAATTATEEQTTATKKQDEAQDQSNKETKEATKDTKDYTGALDSMNGAISVLPAGLQSSAKGVLGLTKGFKGLKFAIAATGIGALLIALAAMFSWFSRTQEGGEKLNKIMSFLGATFDVVLDVVGDFGEVIFNAFSKPQESLKKLGSFIKDNLINRFVGLIELIPALGSAIGLLFEGKFGEAGEVATNAIGKVTLGIEDSVGALQSLGAATVGVFQEISEEGAKALALADRENKLQQTKLDFVVREQVLRDQIATARLNAEDQELSSAARLEANLKSQELTKQVARESVAIAQETADIERERQALGDSNFDDKLALAELDKQIIALNTAQNTELKSLVARQKSLTAEVVKERDARQEIDDAIAARANDRTIIVQSQADQEVQIEADKQAQLGQLRTQGTATGIELAEKELTAKEAFNELEAESKAALILGSAQLAVAAFEAVFGSSKATAVATALINTALGILNALATVPFPLTVPAIALAGVTGAVQVATILATPPPPKPTFARGGMLSGKLHSQGGVDINAEVGEAVINRRSMSDPTLRGLASAINVMGGGVPFMADGGLIGVTEAQNLISKSLGNFDQAPQVVLVTEDLDTVQNRVIATENFSTL